MMNFYSFLIVLVVPLIALFFHAILSRFVRIQRQALAALCGCLGATLAVGLLLMLETQAPWFSLVAFAAINGFALAHIYFHVFNMSETARRIRILVGALHGKRVEFDGYSPTLVIERRLERLRDLGQVEIREEKYFPKHSLLDLVAVFMKAYENLIFPYRKM